MIEGKLSDGGHDPLRTQVVLCEVERGTLVCLRDESGVFREIEPLRARRSGRLTQLQLGRKGRGRIRARDGGVTESRSCPLKAELETQKGKTRDLWRLNCKQLAEMDGSLVRKDEEISPLKDEVARLRRSSPLDAPESASVESGGAPASTRVHRGKAPLVDTFMGEDPECRLDDWFPTLRRAADRNGWTEGDLLIQLAGHLKGRALQEWNLMADNEKKTYSQAA